MNNRLHTSASNLMQVIEHVWPSAIAYILSKLENKSILIVSSHVDNNLLADLSYFCKSEILDFPSWETLPDEKIDPSPDIVGKRLEVLNQLKTKTPKIVCTSLQGALQKVPKDLPLLEWKKGDDLDFDTAQEKLKNFNYVQRPIVADKGQFAVRGGIIDIFPIHAHIPYRLEFFGDTLEDIRTFDANSQVSNEKTTKIQITPAKEQKLTSNLLDYMPEDTLIVFDDLAALEDTLVRLKTLSIDPLFKKHPKLFLLPQALSDISPEKGSKFEIFGKTVEATRKQNPVQKLEQLFHEGLIEGLTSLPASMSVRFICSNASEERALKSQLPKLNAKTTFERGYLSSGLATLNTVYFPYTELIARPAQKKTKWRTSYHTPASEFHELSPGDLVIHFHNGVGKYLGIESRPDHTGEKNDFMILEYSGGSKLFVPISQAHLVSRYIGSHQEHPQLDTLGTKKWHTVKVRAQKAIIGYAKELIEIQAMRKLHGKKPYPEDSEEMQLFEAAFPHVPTEDQTKAIEAIKADMQSEKVFDRLVCGDVGYGKTEVAMRAALKAVIDGGKQVAVLVPTTVLALQHFETFSERMADFPIRVAQLSRFVTPKEIKQTIAQIAEGSVDIVVGTHRLVSKDVVFKDLGLIVIDEEQRFGVRVKEKLKKFKTGVDCLTLSATPIPRTLYMSMTGARDLSTINTPPQDRLPIKTIISERESDTIKGAIMRELARDGQAFFIHNRVETIFKIADELQALVPDAKIAVAHGQMESDELDQVFHTFKSGKADVLVATTLIENGIDIPNANTILIDRAHQFGLSDLYQLRGRVGRSTRASYAYFLVPERRALPEIAQKRLQALVESSVFGGGMKLAMRDLEIRGSGDILGTQQSGHLSQIGFHLYCKLLKRAMHAIENKKDTSFIETKIEFPMPAQIPTTYIPETSIRLEIYHRLGDATSPAEIDKISAELTDRFGKPPLELEWLLAISHIRTLASAQNYTLLKFTPTTLYTERQRGKNLQKKNYQLPQIQTPPALKEFLTPLFSC